MDFQHSERTWTCIIDVPVQNTKQCQIALVLLSCTTNKNVQQLRPSVVWCQQEQGTCCKVVKLQQDALTASVEEARNRIYSQIPNITHNSRCISSSGILALLRYRENCVKIVALRSCFQVYTPEARRMSAAALRRLAVQERRSGALHSCCTLSLLHPVKFHWFQTLDSHSHFSPRYLTYQGRSAHDKHYDTWLISQRPFAVHFAHSLRVSTWASCTMFITFPSWHC